MERFKIKNRIFLILALVFVSIFFHADLVSANDDYIAEVERIEGLVYGNKYSSGKIIPKNQSIAGTFKFALPNETIDKVGEITVCIDFVPVDGNYIGLSQFVKTTVEKRPVNIVFEKPIYKQDDGTDKVDIPKYEYDGILPDDNVRVIGNLNVKYSGTYASEEVPLILSGVAIEGEKKDYYTLSLDDYFGRIYPATVKDKIIDPDVIVGFDEDVYVDVKSVAGLETYDGSYDINNNYTSFLEYEFFVFDRRGNNTNVEGKYNISLKVNDSMLAKERLTVFEKTKDNKFVKLNYTYSDGMMRFEIDSNSKIVFTTRNVEWHFILIFSGIILFSIIFVLTYRLINNNSEYEEEEK